MKKSLRILMLVLLMLCLCACGGKEKTPPETTVPPTTAPNYTAFLDEGLMLLDAGDVTGAIEKFIQAGPAGEAQLEKLREENKEEIMEAARYLPAEAVRMMQELPEGLLDEQSEIQWIAEIYQLGLDGYMERINGEFDYLSWSPDEVYAIRAVCDEISGSALGGTPEGQALTDSYTFLLGIMTFQEAYETYDWEDPGFETAYQIFASCSEGSAGNEVAQAIDWIRSANYMEAGEILARHIVSKDRVVGFISRYSVPADQRTLNERLKYNRTVDVIGGENIYTGPLEQMLDKEGSYRVGIETGSGFPEERYSELKTLCATAPEGKVLFLRRWTKYGTSEKKVRMDTDLMELLPQAYYPDSLEQVEYVIVMDCNYYSNGVYQNGTVRIHETTTLTLYNAAGETLYVATAEGTDEDTMYYSGEAPEFYSAYSPDMKPALVEALTVIAGK